MCKCGTISSIGFRGQVVLKQLWSLVRKGGRVLQLGGKLQRDSCDGTNKTFARS
jgi:hypothetical protein